ncbi:MAG: lamin tail domain-containing protein [Anaerolineae bacterium]|nr:lamin tail domain-containing protein [Thermoflexales bacterium]MDW8407140.1 lamin tail domain-containing protein [Anaerolineae bacterium]
MLPVDSPAQSSQVLISALHYYGLNGNLDEAVQLTNLTPYSVSMDGQWSIRAGSGMFILPTLTINAGARIWLAHDAAAFQQSFGFPPDVVFGNALTFANTGGEVRLVTQTAQLIDSANGDGGPWPAGSGGSGVNCCYRSMERIDAGLPDTDFNWATAIITVPVAWDSAGNPITGTPGLPNSIAVTPTSSDRHVVINEVAWGGTRANAGAEWIELRNNTSLTVSLAGWHIRATGSATRTILLDGEIAPHSYFVVQRLAGTFSAGATANLTATWSVLNNSGERLELIDVDSRVVDAIVYGNGTAQSGWAGPAVQPYTVTGVVPATAQILMRKIDPQTGLPIPDTDTAQDWFSEPGDPVNGRRPLYPGWDYELFAVPVAAHTPITIAVTPDAGFDVLSRTLASATRSIDIEVYTFDQPKLADLLALKVSQGVTVRVLLEGGPVGPFPSQELWMCQRIHSAHSGCWFMTPDAVLGYARYRYVHAKFAIVDGRQLLVSSENFGLNGFPDDDKVDGTVGERGVLALVSAPALIARAQAIFDSDLDTAHADVSRWCPTCNPFGPPPPGFTPVYTSGGVSYTARFSVPLVMNVPVSVELATSPESNLRAGGILAWLYQAGAGDEILVQQMDEPHYWGLTSSNPINDPNPRLQAIIGAAYRGAIVRVLLDRYYDNPSDARSNDATVRYLRELARVYGLDLKALRGDPTAHGIHNKMILARVGGRKLAHIGSWNGTETSAKMNREMTLLIESPQVYDYLSAVFWHDFYLSQPVFAPLILRSYRPPVPITYPLISEVLFNPSGADETGREWIELYNPTNMSISLSGYKIGDAELPGRSYNESMYQFPTGAILPPRSAVVVAGRADLYFSRWGVRPTFELADYDPVVPELLPYTPWSTGTLSLGNANDQVLLLGPSDGVVDAVAWAEPSLIDPVTVPGVALFFGALAADHTLQRWPADRDTNDCSVDFRDQALPSPGVVP